jgi:O-succinylbenzoate synthase
MPQPRTAHFHVEFRAYRRKFLQPLITTKGIWAAREGLIIRLSDDDGRVGYGEAAPTPGFSLETAARDWTWLRRAPEVMTEVELRQISERLACLRWAIFCAQEMMHGRLQPPAKVRKLPVCALLPAGMAGLRALSQRAAEGYRVFKWKIGLASPPEEFSLLEKLLAALPAGARLRLDTNGALSRREWAAWCDGLNALGAVTQMIEFFEQPLPPATGNAGWREQARLAAIAPVPVALDEGIAGWPKRQRLPASRWPGPLVIKPSLLGDAAEFLRWRDKARADLVYSSVFETSVGLQAALCMAAGDAQAGQRALGFGTLAAFAEDGLQLRPHIPGPTLALRALRADDFLELWNRLDNGV